MTESVAGIMTIMTTMVFLTDDDHHPAFGPLSVVTRFKRVGLVVAGLHTPTVGAMTIHSLSVKRGPLGFTSGSEQFVGFDPLVTPSPSLQLDVL